MSAKRHFLAHAFIVDLEGVTMVHPSCIRASDLVGRTTQERIDKVSAMIVATEGRLSEEHPLSDDERAKWEGEDSESAKSGWTYEKEREHQIRLDARVVVAREIIANDGDLESFFGH
jgi:hypothetical protein